MRVPLHFSKEKVGMIVVLIRAHELAVAVEYYLVRREGTEH